MPIDKKRRRTNTESKLITKPVNFKDERYLNATGKNWKWWFATLKKTGAEKMLHKQIAVILEKQFGVSAWWAQSITVRFEQEIGRRIPGETSENTYQANLSKTVSGAAEEIFSRWIDNFSHRSSLNGKKIKKDAKTSVTKKWSYWRVKLEDGSAISINFSQKGKDKVLIQVNHDQLLNEEEKLAWKSFWIKTLEEFIPSNQK
ncbi:MAG TPA: hypothetical protein VGQ09_19140 [Chitinophagaceae bacterium]|jgi:hypothetical protein|nr:hypothetical protein [Chitinophagaceae bacterium]